MNPIWWNEGAPEAGTFLVEVALKSALLIAGLLLVDLFLGSRRASWRNLLWTAVLAGLVLIPLASAWGPALRVPVFPEAQPMVAAVQGYSLVLAAPEGMGAPLQADPPASLPAVAEATGSRAETWGWASALLLAYGAGVCFFLGRLGVGLLYVSSLRRQAQEVEDDRLLLPLHEMRTRLGIRRLVGLATSDKVGSPLQIGIFSPMAILPAQLMHRLDDQTFRAVAAHELAHVRRWDYLLHLLAMVVLAFHWFNPLAWLAVRRLHETGEHACDEWAVRLIGKYEVYARALLDVLGDMRGQRVRWGLGMAYQAEERLERIMAMKNEISTTVGRWARGAVLASVAIGALVLGCSTALASRQSALPGGGKITYIVQESDDTPGQLVHPPSISIFSVNIDGTGREMPAPLQGGVLHSWSADGQKVVFTTADEHNAWRGDIFLMNADGSQKRNLTNDKKQGYSIPSISADGQKVAFSGQITAPSGRSRSAIFVINADGTNLLNLSNSPETTNRTPEISPDGKWVAFSSDRLYRSPDTFIAREGVIFLVDTEGNNLHPLTSTTGIISYEPYIIPNLDWDPTWSPDGKHIAWSNGGDIWVINADGTQPYRVTTSWKAKPEEPVQFTAPVWSPDGTKIAMQARMADGEVVPRRASGYSFRKYSIWVVDVDGTNLRSLTEHQQALRPRWVPVMDRGVFGPR